MDAVIRVLHVRIKHEIYLLFSKDLKHDNKSLIFILEPTTTVSTTLSTQSPCPICYNGGYCNYINNAPGCICPCFYSGPNCQTCKGTESNFINIFQFQNINL